MICAEFIIAAKDQARMKISIPLAVFIVFLTLKLCAVIAWSWWWVTAPLWIWTIIEILFFAVLGAIALHVSKDPS